MTILNAANDLTKKMMTAFTDQAKTIPTGFLSSFFGKNPSEISIYESETVEIDIQRFGEKIAVDVLRGGDGNLNTMEKYSTKLYKPPFYNEYTNIKSSQLSKRLVDQNTYQPVNKVQNMINLIFKAQFEGVKKVLRAIEVQASQALFSGTITFKNADVMDFKRKASHNITPANAWNTANGVPIADLESACIANRIDGKVTSDIAIFSNSAWDGFISNADVLLKLDNRRVGIGAIEPRFAREGAVFQGVIWAGAYRLECYTYDQYYTDEAGATQPYLPAGQAVVLYSGAVLNTSFGGVEILQHAEEAYRQLGISAIPVMTAGKFVPYSYAIKESNLVAGIQSAPLLVPTQIDAITNINAI